MSAIELIDLTDDINEIYSQYLNVICPFIVALETDDTEFPIEILNEIRALTTHMARYQLATDDPAKQVENVKLAKRHIKRAILDCFKYSCLSIGLKHRSLRDDYKSADLHLIDNGSFLSKLVEKEHDAREKLLKAKEAEIDGNTSTDALYVLYQEAYDATKSAYDFLYHSVDKLEFAQANTDKTKFIGKCGLWVGVIGAIIGIVGLVVGIVW